MKETINRLSNETGLSVEVIEKTYKAYWRFIKTSIESLPLKEDLDESSFKKLKTNFNIPFLGKLSCTYERYIKFKNIMKKYNDKHKES